MLNKTLFITIMIFAQFSIAGINDKNHGSITLPTTNIVSVHDGDSFRVTVPQWPSIIGERIPVRVAGIDTPELRSSCKDEAAKQREKALAREAKQFTVAMLRGGKVIELHNIQRGKYFRILADVYVDGVSLGDALIKSGHAVEYDGGEKIGWCNHANH